MEVNGDAVPYWLAIDRAVVKAVASDELTLRNYKQSELQRIKDIGNEGIEYWEQIKQGYQQLTRDEAIAKLIRAEKIDAKIAVIRRAIERNPRI